jgi:hypothetical protein
LAGLVPATHVFRDILRRAQEVVDGRNEPAKGHRSQGSRKHRGVEVGAAILSWPSAEEDSASHINLDKALDILLGDALA